MPPSGFYYSSDLEALEQAGAELLPFSPLCDRAVPAADGLFLGGGFPETHLETLADNPAMAASIRAFVESDHPVYAECGGVDVTSAGN